MEAMKKQKQKQEQEYTRSAAASWRAWWKEGEGRRRRVMYSAKVGLALALVSLSVLLQHVFERIGSNAIWAILTVVVIFEFTVGATLSKGLNRGLGTIVAASLGLLVDFFANFVGPDLEPYVVGCSIFFVGMFSTYVRTMPNIKAKYDYSVVIFLLTFCLVVITGYRVSDNIDIVFERVVTVVIGVLICLVVSVFVFPIWAGDDLHCLIVQNFQGLADSLEGCVDLYFQGQLQGVHEKQLCRMTSKICKEKPCDDSIYKGYRGVLVSKQTQESLAMFASWEPKRGRLGHTYPWQKLVDVGAILRHCAYTVSALHGCVLSEIQAPEALRQMFAGCCTKVGEEISSVLREVASDLRHSRCSRPKRCLLHRVRQALDRLHHTVTSSDLHLIIHPSSNAKPVSHPKTLDGRPVADDDAPPHLPSNLNLSSDTDTKTSPAVPVIQPESLAFAESLSVASFITLLIEIAARMDHLVNALMEYQHQAGFTKPSHPDDGDDWVDEDDVEIRVDPMHHPQKDAAPAAAALAHTSIVSPCVPRAS